MKAKAAPKKPAVVKKPAKKVKPTAKKSPVKKTAAKPVAKPATKKEIKPRAPKYDKAEVMAVIESGLANGVTLRSMCRVDGMPGYRIVYEWISADADLAARIARAREAGYDAIADEIIEIIDDSKRDVIVDEDGSERTNAEVVARSRLRAEMRLKLLAKWSPKKYGERVQNEHSGPDGGNIPVSLAVSFVPSGK